MNARRAVRAVLITQDANVREAVAGYARNGGSFAVALDLDVSLASFTGPQFKVVEQSAPALVLMDFDGAPDLGVSLARDLLRANPLLVPIGIGAPLSSEQLLQGMRAGLTEYLVKPVSPEALSDAVDRLRPRLFPDGAEPEVLARTIGFFSAKGGSGASTVVTNLAIELRRLTNKRTLVMDLDAELGEVSLLFGIQPQFNLVDLIQNFHRIDSELLGSYIEQHDSGVHVLSAPYHPERAAVIGAQEIRAGAALPPGPVRHGPARHAQVVLPRVAGCLRAVRRDLHRGHRGSAPASGTSSGPCRCSGGSCPGGWTRCT